MIYSKNYAENLYLKTLPKENSTFLCENVDAKNFLVEEVLVSVMSTRKQNAYYNLTNLIQEMNYMDTK